MITKNIEKDNQLDSEPKLPIRQWGKMGKRRSSDLYKHDLKAMETVEATSGGQQRVQSITL